MSKIADKYKVYADKIHIGTIFRTGSTWQLLAVSFQFPFTYPSFSHAFQDCIDAADGTDETYTITCVPDLSYKPK